MAHWQDAAVTNDGVEMLNEWMAGRSIEVVSAYGGTGTVSVDELMEQTGLVDQRQRLNLAGEENSADGKVVQVQVSNAGLTEEYELNQVGVFALLDPGKETQTEPKMLFIMQDEKGVTVPPVTEVSFLLELYCKIGITNNGRFQVSIDSAGVATIGRMKEELDRLAASILTGDISAPLETASGEPITTWGGEEIRAHGRLAAGADDSRSYTDMAVSAAMAAMTRMVETKLTGSYIAVR